MTDDCKTIDPTAFGLFIVALVSLPLALSGLLGYFGVDDITSTGISAFLFIGGIFILIASLYAYKAGSNFGFIVFGLVAMGVIFAGLGLADFYVCISLGIIYLVCLVWSIRAKTLKTLTLILLTTALVFFATGCSAQFDGDWTTLFSGVAALLNFLLTLYLAFALADEHIRCY
ncbi:MAG: hypothetical protein Q4Q58_00610 [Thermoplasmata archaeon]|nr:hypothetical protein [Thermoplasmata archaeon]